MATSQTLIAAIDRVIEYFNTRRMDLPDGFFDRKTQFLINGTPFESLLSTAPNDPLVMMLARGPAGYRFTAKALQHAIPDAKLERGEVIARDPLTVTSKVWLSGKLRGTGDAVNALVEITLRLTQAGHVEAAEAVIDPATLQSIQAARLRA
jgi:hypothetical protein